MTKTHTMRSRLISLVLVLVMVLGCLPLSAMAADPPTSSFTQSWGNFEGVRIGASITTGYTLQTVSGSNPIQETKLNLTVLADASIADKTYDYFYIDLQDAEGNTVRRVMWSGFKVAENTPPGGTYEFITAGSVYTQKREDDGTLTRDPSALQPTVSFNGKYAYINGVAYTVEGAGTFPVYAQVGYQVTSSTAVTLPAQRIGTFNIASYSDDVMTKNLTFNLDATDAYYAYSTVAMVANEDYKLPEVTPIRDHYTFKEWKLDDTTTYQPGDTISYTETNKDLMLTAVWELDQVTVDYPDILPTGVAYGDTTPTDGDEDYGSVQSFDLVLDAGYDPTTLFVTANDVLLAPVNYVAGTDGKVTYTYSFTATDHTTIAVSDDLAKLSYVVTMPVGHFTAKLTGNGITSETSTTVEYGGSYTFTVDPEDGYKIMGVYVNGDKLTAGGTGNNEYTVTTVTGPQVVEVVVEAIPNYTVTYVVNDKQYTTQVVAKGEKVAALPENPVVTGYTFDGWYTEQNGSGTQFEADTAVSTNITVYAKLTAKTYTISYNGNGMTPDPTITATNKTYGKTATLDATALTRDGYTFLGWSRNQKATEATYAPGDVFTEEITEGITLYAVWKANTYTVTLPTGTGYTVVTTKENVVNWNGSFTFDVVVDRGYVETEPVVKANDAALSANGEPTDGEGGSKVYSYTISNIQENKVVSITVGKNQTYTVTFEAKGRVYQTQQVEYGYCATVPVAPEVEGYFFNGWKLNGTDYVFSTPVTDDITLVADLVWITNPVTLPVDGDGYSVYHEYTPSATNKLYDVGYNQNFAFKVVVKDGYSDANMVVSANGAPLYYNSKTYDETAKTTTYNYKLYNVKTPYEVFVNGVERKTVTITYIDNGGVGGPGQQVANYYVDGASDNTAVSATVPTRDGYVFQGWAKTNTATTAEQVVYKSGDANKGTLKETTDTTLYAVWAKATATIEIAADVTEQYEGKDVVLTATVTADGEAMTSGSVEFFRVTKDSNDYVYTSLGTAPVNGGKATMTVQASAWSETYNVENYSAKFIPAEGFGYAEAVTTRNAIVNIKSTAIAWELAEDAENPGTNVAQNTLTVSEGTMTAGSTFTLALPDVVTKDGKGTAAYTVQWQEKKAGQDWQNVGAGGKTYTVTEYVSGTVYRAVLTPADPYTKAQAYNTNGTEVDGSYVYTLVTADSSEVEEVGTTTGITLYQNNQELDNVERVLEGSTVDVVVNVTKIDQYVGGTQGWVKLEVFRKDADYTTRVDVTSATAQVDNAGNAYFTVELPAYSYDAVNSNQINFVATFSGDNTFADSVSGGAGTNNIKLKSAAITWNDAMDKVVLIYEGTDTTAASVTEMEANKAYTLVLPDVYAGDVTIGDHGVRMGEKLTFGKDYTVQWQRQEVGSATVTGWQDISGATEASLYVAAEDGAQKYSYRAVVTPKGDYSLAMDVTFGQLTETKVLTTNPTADTVLAETETTLEISNYYTTGANGANDVVAVYPAGRDVVLTATVTADSGKPTGTVTFYYSLNGAPATVIGKAEVNEQTGKATYTWKAPETATSSGIVYAVYDGSEVFETSETQKTDSNVAFLPNTIKMVDDGFQIYDKNGNVVDEPVVEETYILKGAYATVNTTQFATIVGLVNAEQAKGDNPYFTYIWQKSTDSGKTWTDITNSDGKSELEVVFETDETMYRLAAKPVPASGWTGPENGVYSKGLGVDTKATAIEITLTDEAGVEIPNKANRFENTEVNVTVNVSGVKDYQPGTQGYVQLEVVRRHEGGADATVVGTQVSDVDQYGNATFKVTCLPTAMIPPTVSATR